MSDSPPDQHSSNSKSNLIEVQHVGVTAKIQSPLKSMLQASSSTETENRHQLLYKSKTSKYDKFSNADTHVESESTDTSKILYAMRTKRVTASAAEKLTPSKIEFQLYNKPARHRCVRASKVSTCKHNPPKRKLFQCAPKTHHRESVAEVSLLQRLRNSLGSMRRTPNCHRQRCQSNHNNNKNQKNHINQIIFDDLPEPNLPNGQRHCEKPNPSCKKRQKDTCIGIYPFEHGCAEYLRTTDCHPNLLSVVLAERATRYATRFWAEFFGTLHIGVAFVITFLLQSYRFLLYALVNTLLVGFLHMTSDYLIKPILTVAFNGFFQPPLILIYNVFTSIRDILEPIADTANNFLKPVANVLKSVRLIHATYDNRRSVESV